MPTITLSPGDVVQIEFLGVDGQFEIHFDSKAWPQQLALIQTTNFYGNELLSPNEVVLVQANLKPETDDEEDDF